MTQILSGSAAVIEAQLGNLPKEPQIASDRKTPFTSAAC